ncbi:MAG: hypothetical protein IJY46_06805 [Lentisphaeria bacterium]|nr:hypothetical protein [Lentisphaeria bacterium]
MSKWAEYTFRWDDAPLDISPLFADEVPAGKYGFIKNNNGQFEFENGKTARFWGVLINSAACFPEHHEADKVARRLAKFGINMVRLHQFDAEWATPNIFHFTKGTLLDCTRKLDPVSLDRFDYLISALEKEGIYIFMDLLVYRTFKEGDGLENVYDLAPNGAKPYSIFDDDLRALQKEYASQLLTHVNPYTGKALVDDPGMAMVALTNENDMFNQPFPVVAEPYRTRLLNKFRAWAEKNMPGLEIPEDYSFDFRKKEPDETILRFYHDIQKSYYDEMSAYLRSIGVKIPISGNTWSRGLTLPSALRDMDFTCSNVYWDLWGDEGHNKDLCAERKEVFGMVPSKIRLEGKPLVISEWDMVWPNEWRAESPLFVASMAAFQEWSGTTLHTYRYRSVPADCMGGTILGGIAYRRNFETFMDPAKFGLFYAASLMYRRGDVAPAKETQVIALTEKDIYNPVHGMANHNLPNIEAMVNCEKHKTELRLPGSDIPANAIGPDEMGPAELDQDHVLSDTGELFRSWKDGYGWIDTARTKSVYGRFKPGQTVSLKDMDITFDGGFATVTLTSLTGEDLNSARLILITAVGRADNSGTVYNPKHTERIDIGHGPVIFEVINADIKLKNSANAAKLWSIDPDGAYTGIVPSTVEDGIRKIRIGDTYPSIYYLLSI